MKGWGNGKEEEGEGFVVPNNRYYLHVTIIVTTIILIIPTVIAAFYFFVLVNVPSSGCRGISVAQHQALGFEVYTACGQRLKKVHG